MGYNSDMTIDDQSSICKNFQFMVYNSDMTIDDDSSLCKNCPTRSYHWPLGTKANFSV